MIRCAEIRDLDRIMHIYEYARKYMKEEGNFTQWGNDKPTRDTIIDDIRKKQCYVDVDEKNEIHFVFAFIIGQDLTYEIIKNGYWLNENLYGTIHRIASDGCHKGMFKKCLEYCDKKIDNIRIDTHESNKTMRYLIEKYGFRKCGIIFVEDGSERIAYQRVNK